MTTKINNEHKKVYVPNKREQNQTCLDSAEREGLRPKGNVPNLRFPEFQGEWKKCKLEELSNKITRKNKGNAIQNVLSNSATLGLIPQNEYFDREIANSNNTDSYYVIEYGDFVYNPRKSVSAPYGPVNIYTGNIKGIISPLYLCFSVHSILPSFLYYRFKSPAWFPYVYSHGDTGTRFDRVSIKDDVFFGMPIYMPSQKEQKKISHLMSLLDKRIATQNKIIEDLKKLKSAIIEIEYTPNTKTTSHIGNVIEQISKRNKNNAIQNVLSVSNRQGFIKQSDQFENRNVASEDTSNYKIVEKNDLAFNPARINVGSIARLTTFEKGIVSPMYICFRTQESVAPEYIDFFFESKHFYCEIQKRLEGSVRQCLSFEGLCNIPFSLPSLEMQQRIGKRLFTLGQKIKTETDLLELLNKQKQYLLRQMFI